MSRLPSSALKADSKQSKLPAGRYAGVTHINVARLDKAHAKNIRKMLDGYGLAISTLGDYPNPLHPEAEDRETVISHLKRVIEAAEMLEAPIVGTFIGKNKNKTVPQNLSPYRQVCQGARRQDRYRELSDVIFV